MYGKLAFFSVLLLSQVSLAGFPPRTECSNLGSTINIDLDGGKISVLVDRNPKPKYVKLADADVIVNATSIQKMPDETYGCTARSVDFKKIKIMKKDASDMPDAYNRLAQNGALTNYFICVTSRAWMPAPGQTCK